MALIVTSDEYEHEGLRRLVAPAADAEALRGVLGDPQVGGFDVRVLHNQPAHVVQGQIEDLFSQGRPDDVLLLHFSCHGLKSESGELFFAARNTRPNRLGSTAISADFVQRCMRASRSRSIVLLLDCCYGGAFSRGVSVRASGDVDVLDSFPTAGFGGGRGRAVITASSSMEYAFEADRLADEHVSRPSVFTAAVVDGLATGDADRDEDGWVSLNELYDYVFDRVREQNPHQTPSRDVEMQGELYLARSRRRRIRPLPIPPHLEAARTDQNMYTRLGAVSELRSRLVGGDLEAALGARDALADTARTDIRTVAEPAKAALDEAVLRPAETDLHFGRVEQGSATPHRTVRLLGPPLARSCVPHASDDWIHVLETTDGLDISIDTSGAGPLRGSVEVKGPTGEALINVGVDLLPRPRQSPPPSQRPPQPQPQISPPPPPAGEAAGNQTPAGTGATGTPGDAAAPVRYERAHVARPHSAPPAQASAPPTPAASATPAPPAGTARTVTAAEHANAGLGRRQRTWSSRARSVLSPLVSSRTWRETLHLLLNPFAAAAWTLVIVATLSLGARWVATVERGRAAVLLHERIAAPPARQRTHGFFGALQARLADGVAWRVILYVLILLPVGFLMGWGVFLIWFVGLSLFLKPVLYLFGISVLVVNEEPIHSLGFDTLMVVLGLLTLLGAPWVVRGFANGNRKLIRARLGSARTKPSADSPSASITGPPRN